MEKNYGFIYKITCTVNNKIYIGKTKNTIKSRWYSHIKGAENALKENKTSIYLYNAMNKYGYDKFIIEEIEQCDYSILEEREIYWIQFYNSRDEKIGYNICKGGEGGPGGPMFKGHTHSNITKEKMSKDRQGSNNSNYGNRWHHTPDMNYTDLHGEKNPMFGKKQSQHSKELNSQKQSGVIYWSNKSLDIVLRFTKNDIIDEQDLLDIGFYKGNWHCTKEYKKLTKEQRLSKAQQ